MGSFFLKPKINYYLKQTTIDLQYWKNIVHDLNI